MRLLYACLLRLALGSLRLAAWSGNQKAAKGWRGRKGWAKRLEEAKQRAIEKGKSGPWFHVHCASLGEHEQAAPVIAALQARHPHRPVVLTFFSPSGRESVKEGAADHVDYLPWDFQQNARQFHQILAPADSLLVKYELWPNWIQTMTALGTRVHLVSGRFDSGRHPLSRAGYWVRRHLRQLQTIQVQDEASKWALAAWNIESVVSGDPRADRVLEAATEALDGPTQETCRWIMDWKGERRLIILGSAWEDEWNALRPWIGKLSERGWCALIVPHDLSEDRMARWAEESGYPRWSHGRPDPSSITGPGHEGWILDQIGWLRHLYRCGDVAIIGGGWESGVHNTLEAAAFSLPIAVGPKTQGFREIEALQKVGALTVSTTTDGLSQQIGDWTQKDADDPFERVGEAGRAWIETQAGAAERIVDGIVGDTKTADKEKRTPSRKSFS